MCLEDPHSINLLKSAGNKNSIFTLFQSLKYLLFSTLLPNNYITLFPQPLTEDDLFRILLEPKTNLIAQQVRVIVLAFVSLYFDTSCRTHFERNNNPAIYKYCLNIISNVNTALIHPPHPMTYLPLGVASAN